MVKDNQDHFKRGGRTGGPAGTPKQFRDKLSQERATLRRDQEHVLPSERPRAGKHKRQEPQDATEEAEAQLASLHGEQGSILDSLPRQFGAAGVPRSARPIPTDQKASWGGEAQSFENGPFAREVEEEEAPYGYGIPASEEAALGNAREPFIRERGEMRHASHEQRKGQRGGERRAGGDRELSGMQRKIVERFSPIFRVAGEAARAIDKPVKNALETLQWLGKAARKPS